jgi:hypothetical protein
MPGPGRKGILSLLPGSDCLHADSNARGVRGKKQNRLSNISETARGRCWRWLTVRPFESARAGTDVLKLIA